MKGLRELNICESKNCEIEVCELDIEKWKDSGKNFEGADLYHIYLLIYGLYFTVA